MPAVGFKHKTATKPNKLGHVQTDEKATGRSLDVNEPVVKTSTEIFWRIRRYHPRGQILNPKKHANSLECDCKRDLEKTSADGHAPPTTGRWKRWGES
jgi:hypothetical protein